MNKEWLNAKTFGMPRWVFLSLLAGGVVVGLYLRNRRRQEAVAPPETEVGGETLDTSNDPGLAGVGVVSPPGGVYPVTSPVIPEGFGDVIGSLTGVIAGQSDALAAIPNAYTPQTPTINVVLPTGGGPPRTPPKKVAVRPGSHVNTNPTSARQGQSYRTVKAKGGVYHIYKSGKKVFVKK